MGWERIRSAREERSKSWLSTSRSWRRRDLRPWKSIVGLKLNHSNSTLTMSMSCPYHVSESRGVVVGEGNGGNEHHRYRCRRRLCVSEGEGRPLGLPGLGCAF